MKRCVINIEDADWVDVLTKAGAEGITPGQYLLRGVHSPVVRVSERLDRVEAKLDLIMGMLEGVGGYFTGSK